MVCLAAALPACSEHGLDEQPTFGHVSTAEDRAALFDYILAKTLERESFSEVKNRALGLDVEALTLNYRDEMIAADTDEKLFYALAKISNARKDRHLRISLVEGGLELRETAGVSMENYPSAESPILHAPVRFAADFGVQGRYSVFLSDVATNLEQHLGQDALGRGTIPEIGDVLRVVNGEPVDEYFARVEPYHRYSTVNGLWWQFATWLPRRSFQFPPEVYGARLVLDLERKNGARYSISLPYVAADSITWALGDEHRRYPGFRPELATPTFDLYVSETGAPVVLIAWYGFRETLVEDVDRLMEHAEQEGLLDSAVIWDGTRSRGGSRGAYAIQRLSPKRFKTTFGNLRLSDTTAPFVERKKREFEQSRMLDSGVSETMDSGAWLMDWLENDVMEALQAGDDYSDDVPFKLAHAPKDSDGVLEPAPVHFRGSMVVLLGPYGGSHLDQFAAIVADNDLAYLIGMPAGGYSNTWEWEETLVFPISQRPVAGYMWSIGHTIRPNGEVLEGNPAAVDEYIPQTRENYLDYYPLLVSRALEHLGLE
jgi:hypothetical protein